MEGGGVEAFGVRVAPVFVFDGGDGQGLESGPGGGGALGEPLGEVGVWCGRGGGEGGGSGEGVGHGNFENGK